MFFFFFFSGTLLIMQTFASLTKDLKDKKGYMPKQRRQLLEAYVGTKIIINPECHQTLNRDYNYIEDEKEPRSKKFQSFDEHDMTEFIAYPRLNIDDEWYCDTQWKLERDLLYGNPLILASSEKFYRDEIAIILPRNRIAREFYHSYLDHLELCDVSSGNPEVKDDDENLLKLTNHLRRMPEKYLYRSTLTAEYLKEAMDKLFINKVIDTDNQTVCIAVSLRSTVRHGIFIPWIVFSTSILLHLKKKGLTENNEKYCWRVKKKRLKEYG
eukprot:13263_1